MRLVSFQAKRFRSIQKTPKLMLGETMTTLLGPNNEGKSNTLRAFALAMEVLEKVGGLRGVLPQQRDGGLRINFFSENYKWKRDYPVDRQMRDGLAGATELVLDFEFSDEDIRDFQKVVGSTLTKNLPLEIRVGAGYASVRVLKKGPGAKVMSRKAPAISRFIGRRLDFHYIPAIRTSAHALKVVNEIVESRLKEIEELPAFVEALKRIEELQKPVLSSISKSLEATLKAFLPEVSTVDILSTDETRSRALRKANQLLLDDGTRTDLSTKGDGVQSLAAISLIRYAVASTAGDRHLVFAIEEPESHIHPGAMHRLREVLDEIANSHQVIVTTHCPVFVQRAPVSSNIIIEQQKARPAKSLEEIRKSLGVRVHDNLQSSEVALVVEGEDDRIALSKILPALSSDIAKAFQSNRLAIDTLGGSTNLSYKLNELRNSLCSVYVFLDNDQAGKDAFSKAEEQGLITLARVTFATVKGMPESELEDLYDEAAYRSMMSTEFGEMLESRFYKNHRAKWTMRMANAFQNMGKSWDQFIEMRLKHFVAEAVAAAPTAAIRANRIGPIESLVHALESLLKKGGPTP